MDLETINVESLKNTIYGCKNTLNSSSLSNLLNEYSNPNIWVCSTKNNLTNALVRLKSYYESLESLFNHYLGVANYIAEYQEKTNENNRFYQEYQSLDKRLYYDEEYEDRWYNQKVQKYEYETKTRTVKDTQVERQMQNLSHQMDQNQRRIDTLKNMIYNAIN